MRERLRIQLKRSSDISRIGLQTEQSAKPSPVASIQRALASGGQPLAQETRASLQPSFDFDFSQVSIFSNEPAAEAAGAVDADAFTLGSNIVFGAGRHAPETPAGRHLLTHELAHVTQQAAEPTLGITPADELSISSPGDADEQAADRMADQVMRSGITPFSPAAGREGAVSRPAAAQHAVIQRWAEGEHKTFGDQGSGGREYAFGQDGSISEVKNGPAPASKAQVPFQLTHGDINLLGDWFDLNDTITVEENGQSVVKPNPDSLFRMASRPSPMPGAVLGTQDEIIFALKKNLPHDPRFSTQSSVEQPDGGVWANITFTDDVTKAVNNRYLQLASRNFAHFPSPQGSAGTAAGSPVGHSYRSWHEDALWRAFMAGQTGRDIGEGLAREAAAQHFLTDYFSAGHMRTPIAEIRSYWEGVYPLFFGNLKKKISLDVARTINANETTGRTVFGTVNQIYDVVYKKALAKTKGIPPFTFGDVVGRVVHDVDNVEGLAVRNDLGEQWYTYGDSHLSTPNPANRTADMAQLAVHLGNTDIEHAHHMGSVMPGMVPREDLFEMVRKQAVSPATPGEKYAPEQVVPYVDPTRQSGVQQWKADSMDALWGMQVRTDLPKTFGDAIRENLDSGEIGSQLKDMQEKFDEEDKDTGLHPRDAYIKGFLEPMMGNPKEGLRGIIDFDPSQGQVFFNEDDMVMEELTGTDGRPPMNDKELEGMTLNERANHIKAIVDCTFCVVTYAEGEQVIRLFRTTKPADRSRLYELVEGHAWNGDWKEGVFTDDDDIYNGLEDGQLAELRNLINGR